MASPAEEIQPIAGFQPRAVAFMSTRVARLRLFTNETKVPVRPNRTQIRAEVFIRLVSRALSPSAPTPN